MVKMISLRRYFCPSSTFCLMSWRTSPFRLGLTLAWVSLPLVALLAQAAQTSSAAQHVLRIRFIDSATGYAVQPEAVEVFSHTPGLTRKRLGAAQIGLNGRAALPVEHGRHTLTVVSAAHRPMYGDFEMTSENLYNLDFYLDPLEEPIETRPATLKTMQQDGLTLI